MDVDTSSRISSAGETAVTSSSKTVISVTMLPDFSATANHSKDNNQMFGVYAAGSNIFGQIGGKFKHSETHISTYKFLQPLSSIKVASISSSLQHSLLVSTDGVLYSCGSNEHGELGRIAKQHNSFRPIESLTQKISQASAGMNFSICVSDRGEVFSWGKNNDGQLGLHHREPTRRPKKTKFRLTKAQRVIQVCAGARHALALCDDARVFAWGSSLQGQLGNGTYVSSDRPLLIEGLTGKGIISIACGEYHNLALSAKHALYGWGGNQFGQLGVGDTKARLRPSEIQSLRVARPTRMFAGSYHTLCISGAGKVFSFGQGHSGQLGHGLDTSMKFIPKVIERITEKVESIACGFRHSVLLLESGKIIAFGSNASGQLGDGNIQPAQKKPKLISHSILDQLRKDKIENKESAPILQLFCGGNSTFFNFQPKSNESQSFGSNRHNSMLSISLDFVKKCIQRCTEARPDARTQVLTNVRKLLSRAFSSISVFNASFWKSTSVPTAVFVDEAQKTLPQVYSKINLSEAKKVFQALYKSQIKPIVNTVNRALNDLGQALYKYQFKEMDHISVLLTVIANPQLTATIHYDLVANLVSAVQKLNPKMKIHLVNQIWGAHGADYFAHAVKIFVSFMEEAVSRKDRSKLWPTASFLADLHAQNGKIGVIDISHFYSNTISLLTDLRNDYNIFKTQGDTGIFTLCKFPFLLNAEAKRRLLRCEALSHMSTEQHNVMSQYFAYLRHHVTNANTTEAAQINSAPPNMVFRLRVRRRFLLNDSLLQLHEVIQTSPMDLKKPLIIEFVGEDGVDEGGLRKEV